MTNSLWSSVQRIQTSDKIVRHRLLNTLGCQVGRVIAAEALVRRRRRRLGHDLTAAEAGLVRDGVATIDGFLPPALFDAVVEEMDRAEATYFRKRPSADKFGIIRQKIALLKAPAQFPVSCGAIMENESLLRLARVGEGWAPGDGFAAHGVDLRYERLDQATAPGDVGARDAEVSSGDMHADTFHYVTKAFLTLNDVTLENSPYTYARGTQRLTLSRLFWEYRNSLRGEQYTTDEYHNRVWESELDRLGIHGEPLEVPKNTLIVTNTFGFHRRGAMTRQGAMRRMLRLDFRSNPFRE